MKRLGAILLAVLSIVVALPAAQPPVGPDIRLVLLIAVDQFRYDYLTRFRAEYSSGIKRLLDEGAVFTNANLEHYPTVTAIGHSTMLTGATPSVSGIIGNDWFDRETGAIVTSVSDPSVIHHERVADQCRAQRVDVPVDCVAGVDDREVGQGGRAGHGRHDLGRGGLVQFGDDGVGAAHDNSFGSIWQGER